MTQKSSDQLFESLSALADGEASELELHRILKSISDDEEVQQRWTRYHLMRAIMRKDGVAGELKNPVDLLSSIRVAIDSVDTASAGVAVPVDAEHKPESSSSPRVLQWHAWLSKSAVAASVAAAFVFGLGQLNYSQNGDTNNTAVLATAIENVVEPTASSTLSAPLGFELPAVESRTVSTAAQGNYSPTNNVVLRNPLLSDDYSDAQSQILLNRLHILHAQRASLNGGIGIMPFARISDMEAAAPQKQ